jgi:hypothetical protein
MTESLAELDINKVAIVDDNLRNVETLQVVVENCNCASVPVIHGFQNLNKLVQRVMADANGVLCDHRLCYGTEASFTGAEAVATWFDHKFPAILVSGFAGLDANTSIRLYRRKIPAVIPRGQVTRQTILEGFVDCLRELRDDPPVFRRPRRAIVRVENFDRESGIDFVEAFVPQWNPDEAVRFPRRLLSRFERVALKPGMRFIADVNIDARRADELFFDNFELAPEAEADDGLA